MQLRDVMKRGDPNDRSRNGKTFPNSGILKSGETVWSWAL